LYQAGDGLNGAIKNNRMPESDTYRVKLEIFEGPLDLLLYLIRKNEVDVYDIPIAPIVEQYMAYLDLMRSLSLDVVGDFLVMAATLTHIKSRMLLPLQEGDGEDEDGEDPRLELVRKLVEYQQFKEAAEDLSARPLLGRDIFVRGLDADSIGSAADAAGIVGVSFEEVGVFELLTAFRDVVERLGPGGLHEVSLDRVSIMDRINQILELIREVETIGFERLFVEGAHKSEVIVTFLALLELIRLRVVRAYQERPFGPITLARAVAIDDNWITENLPGLQKGLE